MDEKAIDAKGISPLKPELDRIAALSDKKLLTDEIARLHEWGANVLFSFGSGPDDKNSGQEIADNGGLRVAYMALMSALAGRMPPPIDGFTPAQRFFLGWGQVWCENVTKEALRLAASVDPHSPARERVNGVVQNMPEFQSAFSCRAGQPMVRRPECRVW